MIGKQDTMPNTNAADWQDDLETYHDSYANVIVYDEDQVTHLTDFQLQPADLRVVFAALRDAATECGHDDARPLRDPDADGSTIYVCLGCHDMWNSQEIASTPETAEQITQRVLALESLGTWEERLKAAVYLARGEQYRVTESPTQIAERVLDNHRIRPDWRRTGGQIIPLLAEAVRIARGEES
ncbi:hypothetical protein SEA_BLAB_98 [Microbacterium phage Blab]|nr:hypothetical protein SEA_BLAB_98 [Microbacterium phage Blab]